MEVGRRLHHSGRVHSGIEAFFEGQSCINPRSNFLRGATIGMVLVFVKDAVIVLPVDIALNP
jgi:hypothetical protein